MKRARGSVFPGSTGRKEGVIIGKVLLINGSPNEKGCTYTALSEVEKQLWDHRIPTELLFLGQNPIHDCIDCKKCWKEKVCVFDDHVNRLLSQLDKIDALVIGSPVHYAGITGHLKSFLDRLFYSSGGRTAGKLGAAVVSCRRAGSSSAFDQINKYFTISRMPIVSSQYWNQVHGFTVEDVLMDEEGLQTMRTLGENMAWLLKCIAAGRVAGIPEPRREKIVRTHFIQ